jgi:hypothetical protein
LSALSSEKQGFVKVILDEQYERLFTFVDKRKVPQPNVKMQIEVRDPIQKKGVVHIVNNEPLVDLWLYTTQQGLHLEENFLTLLPGEHTIEFTYQNEAPSTEELHYLIR